MGLFTNPLGYAGYPPDPTTAQVVNTTVRSATQTEADAGVLNNVYISPKTLAGPGLPGAFTTLTSSSTTTLGSGSGVVTTLGNLLGATAVNINVGTGGFTLDGAATSTLSMGASLTTGNIVLGGAQNGNGSTTGVIEIGRSTGVSTVLIAPGSGASVVRIANTQTGGSVKVGALMTTGTLQFGGDAGTVATGQIDIAGGTGAQTTNIATGNTGAKTVSIANGNGANVVAIGSLTAAASTTIQAGSGNLALNVTGGLLTSNSPTTITLGANASTGLAVSTAAGTGVGATFTTSGITHDSVQLVGGSIKVPAPTLTGATPQINGSRTGQVGFSDTVANGGYTVLTITNATVTASSVIIAMATCPTVLTSAVQIAGYVCGSGTVAFNVYNAGATSTAGNTTYINYWVLN